ncbi:MAG: haloalkane dehalogenase [Nitrospinae bacterium]|jgi:haloalkane dehalogenase|nr:haloalkane dehalogenase [Nitrospinota bacterium]MDP6136157.1 haloalkane dehalogenase [Arenicellales bacterium]|tara:strand:- start:4581 stop:5624 length:1044 start_codon:yes stop_codon:yes gene_type:complete
MTKQNIILNANGEEFVRIPDECFENLPDFPYQPNYVEVGGWRQHYVDEGPRDGLPVLLLHGQPDWSYLYRKMIPIIVDAGYRAIAPDLIGMGRSDKPTNIHIHTVEQHTDWLNEFIEQLGLKEVTLFCQDWGGMIGLTELAEHPEYFKSAMASNGSLTYTPEPHFNLTMGLNRDDYPVDNDAEIRNFADFLGMVQPLMGEDMSGFFQKWMEYALTMPDFKPSENLIADAGVSLSDGEIAAYDAPYPGPEYRTAIRALPSMASLIDVERALAAWEKIKRFDKPFLTVFGEFDPLIGQKKVQDKLIDNIPGAKGQPHDRLPAGHFIQESKGEEVARRLVKFIDSQLTQV